MVMIDFKDCHKIAAAGTFEGIIAEGEADRHTPLGDMQDKSFLIGRDSKMEMFRILFCSGIQTVIPNHFEMLIGDVTNDTFDEINSGDRFRNKFIVLMAIVVKGDEFAVVFVNS